MSKLKLSKGKKQEPEFFVLFGVEGIGKTTFATQAPDPVVIDIEGGSSQIDTTRVEDEDLKTVQNVVDTINELAQSEYKTLILDSASRLEKIIWNEVAARAGKNSIEDIGYAKGYIFALEDWEKVLTACQNAKKIGKNVIIIAHNHQKTFNDPTMVEGYTRYELELHHKAAGLIKKNVDAIYFANYKVLVKDGRGLDTGERCMYTERRAGHDAKNRFGLPYEVNLNWSDYMKAKSNSNMSAEVYIRQIEGLLIEVTDMDTKEKIKSAIAGETDTNKLKSYLNRVNIIIGEQE